MHVFFRINENCSLILDDQENPPIAEEGNIENNGSQIRPLALLDTETRPVVALGESNNRTPNNLPSSSKESVSS